MGIPKFVGRWIMARKFPGVVQYTLPSKVSGLWIDMNGMIHSAAQKVWGYGDEAKKNPERARLVAKADPLQLEVEFHQVLVNLLLGVVQQVQPRDILAILIDGPAPMAKIQQQRQRRYRAAQSRSPSQPFDSNSVTPGTEFMKRLDNYLQRWIAANQALLPPKVIYGSHLVPGEGEHKIMDLWREGAHLEGIASRDPDAAQVLYGLDAD